MATHPHYDWIMIVMRPKCLISRMACLSGESPLTIGGDRVCHVALYAYIRYYHDWCPMCSEVTYRGIVVMTEIARPHHRWLKTGRWSWFSRVPLDICFMTEDWFMILWVYLWTYDYVMNKFYDAYNLVYCFQAIVYKMIL